jgi:hypothetical protein
VHAVPAVAGVVPQHPPLHVFSKHAVPWAGQSAAVLHAVAPPAHAPPVPLVPLDVVVDAPPVPLVELLA